MPVFLTPRKPKTTVLVFTMSLATGSKHHGFYSVLPRKTRVYAVFRCFQHVARSIFSVQKAQNQCAKKSETSTKKMPKIDLPDPTWQKAPF